MKKWINEKGIVGKNVSAITSYQIEIKMKKASSELVFEELWIDEKRYKFHLSREDRKVAGSFDKKEILKLNIISEIINNTELILPAKSSKGIMILNYTFRNKKKFLCIKKFREIEYLRLIG